MAALSILSAFRALALRRQAPAAATRLALYGARPKQQQSIRALSQAALAPSVAARPTPAALSSAIAAGPQQQQTRGMKVHSSVKKRCEHCKVRVFVLSVQLF